jgi:hypothetical protein
MENFMPSHQKRKIVRTPPQALRIVREPQAEASKASTFGFGTSNRKFAYGTGNRKFAFGTGNRKFAFGTGNRQFG